MNKTSKYRKKNKRNQGKKAIRFMTQVLNSFVNLLPLASYPVERQITFFLTKNCTYIQ